MILQTLKLNKRTIQSRVKSVMSRPLLLRGAEMKEAVKELWCSNIYESSHKCLED